jgi:hypothetical protein
VSAAPPASAPPPPRPLEARPPIAWGALAIVAIVIVGVHAICLTQYGWFRDELYYMSCSRRLAWGYVDEPPLSIAVLALVRAMGGDRLGAIRLAAALTAAAVSLVTALIARELGGRRFAQVLAAIALGLAPISLGIGHFYSMNAFDFFFWALATLLALRAFARGTLGGWIALGVVLGLGLLNKWSVMWLGAGLAVGLLLSPARPQLATAGPWFAALIAGLMFTPNVYWETRHGWATLEFMQNARSSKMVALAPLSFLVNQVFVMGPGNGLLWVVGLFVALARERWRPLAAIYIVTLAILLASGSARVEYLTLACPALFAAGAAWWESRGTVARRLVPAIAALLTLPIAPLALPVLPVETLIAYQAALGQKPRTEEHHRMGRLSQQDADMFGWPEMADSVARVAATLPTGERARAIVIVNNYGEAGALEQFGRGRIPAIACQHNNWYRWGPPVWDGGTAILVGRDSSEAAREFSQVIVAGVAGHPLAMPYEQNLPILIARGFHADLAKAWAQGKSYR